MLPDLDLMLKLQVIDYDLGELERSKEYLPDLMSNLRREIDEAREKFDGVVKSIEEERLAQKTLELEVKSKEADLARLQQQMMTIKTNREYDALISEIDAIKAAISAAETRQLNVMDSLTVLESQLPDLRARFEQVSEENAKQLAVLQEKIDSIGSKAALKEGQRSDLTTQISRATISVYERVRKGRAGGAAVVVVRKRACSGCNAGLTPKKVQEVKKGDRVSTCDSCGRILYWNVDVSA